MQNPPLLNVVGGYQVRVEEIRARWSGEERRRRAAKGQRLMQWLAALLAFDEEDPAILAVGAPCVEDLLRVAE